MKAKKDAIDLPALVAACDDYQTLIGINKQVVAKLKYMQEMKAAQFRVGQRVNFYCPRRRYSGLWEGVITFIRGRRVTVQCDRHNGYEVSQRWRVGGHMLELAEGQRGK